MAKLSIAILIALITLVFVYFVLNFLYECLLILKESTGSYFGTMFLPEKKDLWWEYNMLITLLETRFLISVMLLLFWVWFIKKEVW